MVWTNVQRQGSILKVSCRAFSSPTPRSLSSASPPPHPQQHWPFYCLRIFVFGECCVGGVIQSVVFSNWLHSFSNMHLGFLYIFPQLDSSFLFSSDCWPMVCMYHSLSTQLQSFLFSPAMNGNSCCPTSLSAFSVVSVADFAHSNRYCRFLNDKIRKA